MGWAVGQDRGRWVGYGVPSICDMPECGTKIDRGLSYICGGEPRGGDHGCGLFFCSEMRYVCFKDDEIFDEDSVEPDELHRMESNGEIDTPELCPRCAANKPPYGPTPDTDEWALHVLTDDSWREWREKNPDAAGDYYAQVRDHAIFNPLVPPPRGDLDDHQVWTWTDSGERTLPGHWIVRGTGLAV